eukprot:11530322-Prorocentrum_lima.AAC.1
MLKQLHPKVPSSQRVAALGAERLAYLVLLPAEHPSPGWPGGKVGQGSRGYFGYLRDILGELVQVAFSLQESTGDQIAL